MVAHFVKTQKPTEIRATFLLFRYCVFSMDALMLGENTLRLAFGNQVPDEDAPDYKTRNSVLMPDVPLVVRGNREDTPPHI